MSFSTYSRHRAVGLLALVLAAAALLVGGVVALTGGSGGGTPEAGPSSAETSQRSKQQAELLGLARRHANDPMARGRADAPVVMIEYSDFQCPYCRQFAQTTEPELVKKYVVRGILRIEWRNYPIFGDESRAAALASYAAGRQGRFWQYHDELYTHHPKKKNTGAFSEEKLAGLAKSAGVPDLDRFRTDMASSAARKALDTDTDEGYNLGVSSTPAFLINGHPVLGAQPASVFETTIEQAQATARKANKAGQGAEQ